jgi:hypothetical protein
MTEPYQPQQPYQYPPPPGYLLADLAQWQPQPQQQFPGRAVSRQKLNPFETMFHAVATLMTCGLWGFVWWARVRSRKTVTRYM